MRSATVPRVRVRPSQYVRPAFGGFRVKTLTTRVSGPSSSAQAERTASSKCGETTSVLTPPVVGRGGARFRGRAERGAGYVGVFADLRCFLAVPKTLSQ